MNESVALGDLERDAQIDLLGTVDGAGEMHEGTLVLWPAREVGGERGGVVVALKFPQAVERHWFALTRESAQLTRPGQALADDGKTALGGVGLLPVQRAPFRIRGHPFEHDCLLEERHLFQSRDLDLLHWGLAAVRLERLEVVHRGLGEDRR